MAANVMIPLASLGAEAQQYDETISISRIARIKDMPKTDKEPEHTLVWIAGIEQPIKVRERRALIQQLCQNISNGVQIVGR